MDRFDELIEALKDKNRETRLNAIEELGKAKDPKAVDPLCWLLYDPYIALRCAAVNALVQIGDNRSAYFIAGTWLGRDEDPDTVVVVRELDMRWNTEEENLYLARSILKLGPSVFNEMTNIVEIDWVHILSAHSKIRWYVALLTLWLMPEELTVDLFKRLCRHRHPDVRMDYFSFLRDRKDQRSIDLVYELFCDGTWENWDQAAYFLTHSSDRSSSEAFQRVLWKLFDNNRPLYEKAIEVGKKSLNDILRLTP
jgi:hypothetical protein